MNSATDIWLGIIAICMAGLLGTLVLIWLRIQPTLSDMEAQLHGTLSTLRQTLLSLDVLLRELREQKIIEQAKLTLISAQGATGRLDPLAADVQATLAGAREMMDDATQTSQSVRTRVEDLAATQRELTALTGALADVAGQLRDGELAARLSDLIGDASLLAADIGLLAENASSMLDSGKPLLSNVSGVLSGARQRATGIGTKLGALREGLAAGVESFREGRKP